MEFGGLKVLMISSDRNIAVPGSAVSLRMKEYGKLVEELHIVLMCDKTHGLKETKLDTNVWVYPTNSGASFLRPLGAASLGKKIVLDKKFVRGKSLVTADSLECGWAGVRVKNTWRIPLEVQLHGDPFSPYFSGFQNGVRKFFARSVLKSADSVRTVSRGVAERIQAEFGFGAGKIFVLPIYIDMNRIEEGKVSFDLHARYGFHFILLVVARLTKEKNVAQAIRVLAKVHAYFPDAGLVLVGAGPEEGNLKDLSKSLGVSNQVIFAGWQEDVTSFYRTANLFLQTSRFEGYGLALVEAGLSGLPVVTTPVGIATELENGIDAVVCPQDDDEFMWKAVYDLIQDNARRETMRTHLKRTLEAKLVTKDAYLAKLKENWETTASRIHE
ncbi:MAG: hypothetical protein JWN50_435 [Parcubacteria group bacterium]|nr:hypothetical protein [Parcubacteria group bacterium]